MGLGYKEDTISCVIRENQEHSVVIPTMKPIGE